MHKNNRKLGFTLAELIAVVIIVSLMATFAVGYYKRSVEQSRFAEGLMVANAVVEAINRRNEENNLAGDAACRHQYNIGSLDIEIRPCPGGDKFCGRSRYFEIKMVNNGGVDATRIDGPYRNGIYKINILPHCAANNADRVSCVASGGEAAIRKGKTFCESMGYTSCSLFLGKQICTKP